ncbi:Uma2 family endonuclease [Streptomyces sp. B6B3]|uniref:Uma2 family endonuclease n=1 Tax=Streptomyces sp. B6B3 TaxID=3153570 RepID=UPI00325EB9DB
MAVTQDWMSYAQDEVQLPKGLRLRLTTNGLTLVPITRAHRTTQRRIENQIEAGLPGWTAVGEFRIVPARDGYRPEPDAGAVPSDQSEPGDVEYDESLLPFVVEVVSPESANRDYHTKAAHYALRGIPAYLVVNLLTGRWTLFTRPADGEYQHTVIGAFGEKIEIPVAERTLVLDSSEFLRV